MNLYKYSGAGNDFLIADGREKTARALCCTRTLSDDAELCALRSAARIRELCNRQSGFVAADGSVGADGVLILCDSGRFDFRMEYYNSDGSSGMMCGNGGRCITAFADYLGIVPGKGSTYFFEAADGPHAAEILSRDGRKAIVRLGMRDAADVSQTDAEGREGYFIDTGARHFVTFVENVDETDVGSTGARLRKCPEFAPQGANIDFVEPMEDGTLKIRTFEKGVEAETLSCGTGCVAAAVAALLHGESADLLPEGRLRYRLCARIADLSVDFRPGSPVCDIFLTGPVERI